MKELALYYFSHSDSLTYNDGHLLIFFLIKKSTPLTYELFVKHGRFLMIKRMEFGNAIKSQVQPGITTICCQLYAGIVENGSSICSA